jgi:predicted rRNA methylase YqxC with S4 and FtsJ domains
VHRTVLARFGEDAVGAGFAPTHLMQSPVTGAEGNVEFLALLEKGSEAGSWAAMVDALNLG